MNAADNVADGVWLNRRSASEELAGDHAFGKHVLTRAEFKGLDIRTRQQFANHIEKIMNNPSAVRQLRNGRTAYWDDATGTVVIRDPGAVDGGTAFRPTDGREYFERLN